MLCLRADHERAPDCCAVPVVCGTFPKPGGCMRRSCMLIIHSSCMGACFVLQGAGEDMMDEEIVKAGGKVEFDAGE